MVAPTPMMPFTSLAGEPMVFVMPASPVLASTVMPCLTASSSKTDTGSVPFCGMGLPPKDCESTSTWSWLTAQSRPCRIVLLVENSVLNTFMTARLAPGATPRIRMSQCLGSGRFGFTTLLRS